MTANAAERLIQHYVDNFRDLPWRVPPGQRGADPYRVWLSEVMLQQTTVAAVRPRFERFVERWSTIEALAGAAEEDVLREWAGLGYYARGRNLLACAREIVKLGGFPRSSSALQLLPGIGPYTSAAIAAIAFGERAPAVDTNVARVLARLRGLRHPSKRELEAILLEMLPADAPGDFIQALMDLGAGICRSRRPRCCDCPLASECVAFASGSPEDFPERRAKSVRPHRHGLAYWTERDGQLWLVRRPAGGLLGGMAALPGNEWTEGGGPATSAIASVRHVFTHFALHLDIVVRSSAEGDGWWHPIDELDLVGLPTLYRKAVSAALSNDVRHFA